MRSISCWLPPRRAASIRMARNGERSARSASQRFFARDVPGNFGQFLVETWGTRVERGAQNRVLP